VTGTNEFTGKVISGEAYVRQCVRRILKLPKYSMLMHREVGPDIQPYIAASTTDVWMLSLTAEIVQGIESLIPNVKVVAVSSIPSDGQLNTSVSVQWQQSVFSVNSATV
jgi:phage baseplate assembly protein W